MSSPKLKNYTTIIPAERSIAEIEQLLLQFGAVSFFKQIDRETKQFSGMVFVLRIEESQVPYRLQANVKKVQEYIYKEYRSKTSRPKKSKEDFAADAYKIAWRLMKDWVHSQLSIIATEMVKTEEVFLPYMMIDNKSTFYDKFASGTFKKMLPEFKTNGE